MRSGGPRLCAFHRADLARADRLAQRGMVALVQVRVSSGKVGDGTVEDVALAEVRRDRDPITGACMCPREGPAASMPVQLETGWRDRIEVERGLPVPQLTNVEIARN